MSLTERPRIVAWVVAAALLLILGFVLPTACSATIPVPTKTFTGQTNAIGVATSTDTNGDCTYVIFHDEIVKNCPGNRTLESFRNIWSFLPFLAILTLLSLKRRSVWYHNSWNYFLRVVPQPVVDYQVLEGRKILRWAKTADANDVLYFVAAYPSDTSNFGKLYSCNGLGEPVPWDANVTISSAGSYAHLNSEYVVYCTILVFIMPVNNIWRCVFFYSILVIENGQSVLFMGEYLGVYGLQIFRQGSSYSVSQTERPAPGNMTNPFFTLLGPDVVYFRGFLNGQAQLYGFNITTPGLDTPIPLPIFSARAPFVEIFGPTATASNPASVVYIDFASSVPRYLVCNLTAEIALTCDLELRNLTTDVRSDFKAIVAVSDTIYVFFNNTVFQPQQNLMAPVPGLVHVYHGSFFILEGVVRSPGLIHSLWA
jgi:hypothetical protein